MRWIGVHNHIGRISSKLPFIAVSLGHFSAFISFISTTALSDHRCSSSLFSYFTHHVDIWYSLPCHYLWRKSLCLCGRNHRWLSSRKCNQTLSHDLLISKRSPGAATFCPRCPDSAQSSQARAKQPDHSGQLQPFVF